MYLLKSVLKSKFIIGAKCFSSGIKHLGIVGSGQMGTGIAIVGAKNPPYQVTMIDQTFKYTTKFEDFADCDFVVEAVNQNLELKLQIFKRLDKIVKPEAILATNTSSISLTKLAAAVSRPTKMIGTHFMNPVPKMKIVEVIRGIQTSDQTLQTTKEFIKEMQKQIVQSKDAPGFIINRIFIPYLNEAIFTLYEGVATREDIDKGVKFGLNLPMGPLQLCDFIGLDTQDNQYKYTYTLRVLAIQNVLYNELKDSKYRPCTLLVNMVNAGYLGRKSGQGFYHYPPKK